MAGVPQDRMRPHPANRAAIAAAALVTILVQVGVHVLKWPDFGGWWAGFDQAAYLAAARAWTAGDLAPAAHLYPSGYALLAAPFVRVIPAEPFMLVDLAATLLALGLTADIAGRLAPEWRWAPAAGAASFLVATLSSRAALAVWVVPWTTTPAAPLVLAAIALALRHAERPGAGVALGTGCAACLVAAFRPADAAVLLAVLGTCLAAAALRHRLPARVLALQAAAFAVGAAAPVPLLVGLHVLVHGWAPGPYLEGSARIGFDAGLIPQRWVLLALDPRPVFGSGIGLAVMFPWVLPGLAGMLACVLGRAGRGRHAIALAAVLALWLLYLAYRDLHPTSLWRFYNYHYFKWTQPILVFYALLLLRRLVRRDGRMLALAATAVVLAVLTPWRAGLTRGEAAAGSLTRLPDGRGVVTLPFELAGLADGAWVSAPGGWDGVPGTAVGITAPDRPPVAGMTAGAYPVAGGLLVLPVRRPVPGSTVLQFDAAVPLEAAPRVAPVRLAVRLGLP